MATGDASVRPTGVVFAPDAPDVPDGDDGDTDAHHGPASVRRPAAPGPRQGRRSRRRLLLLAAAAAVLLGLPAVAPPDDDSPTASGQPEASTRAGPSARGERGALDEDARTEQAALWVRDDVVRQVPPVRTDVVRAGPDRVVVGGSVVTTTGRGRGGVQWLPRALLAAPLAPDGRWAVAEAGGVTIAALGGGSAGWTAVTGDWSPAGVAVGWHDGDVVLTGTGGRLGLVERTGDTRWVTETAVEPTIVGGGLVVGVDDRGRPVAVSLEDGAVRLRARRTPPLLLRDGGALELVGEDRVQFDGRSTWVATVPDASTGAWVSTGDGLVHLRDGAARLLAPTTGTIEAVVEVGAGIAVAGGVVGVVDGTVVRRRWDGSVAWQQPFDGRRVTGLQRIDDDRFAVELVAGSTRLVKVVDTDGVTLATTTADEGHPRRARALPGASGHLVGVARDLLEPIGGLSWIDVRSGREAAADIRPWSGRDGGAGHPRGTRVMPDVAARLAIAETLLGTTRQAITVDPFGGLEPDLVAVDARDASVLWRERTLTATGPLADEPALLGPLSVDGEHLVVEAGTAAVRARSLADGRPRWTVRPLAPLATVPVATGAGRLVVALADGDVLVLDGDDGSALGRAALGARATALEPIAGRGVAVGTADGVVHVLDHEGEAVRRWPLGDRAVVDLRLVAGVLVAAVEGRLVALDPS